MKRRGNPGWGFGAFETAQRTMQGYEAIHRLRKDQCEGSTQGNILVQNRIIDRLFGLAA
jgi:transposase-like protein